MRTARDRQELGQPLQSSRENRFQPAHGVRSCLPRFRTISCQSHGVGLYRRGFWVLSHLMEQRHSGRHGLTVSRLGLGTMTWGRDTDEHEAKTS